MVDEAHVARGVFGSHVAMVLRRLRRLVAHYGGSPAFVHGVARPIGNPSELASRLTGLPFDEVTEDASPRGEKLFVLWDPPLIDPELGLRRSAVTEASWFLARPGRSRVRARSRSAEPRKAAELVAEFARRELTRRSSPW